MYTINKAVRPHSIMLMFLLFLGLVSCKHSPIKNNGLSLESPNFSLAERDISLIFMPYEDGSPAHILYQKNDRYAFGNVMPPLPFKREFYVDPLMKNVKFSARIEKNGRVLRQIEAKKSIQSLLSNKKTVWSPVHAKWDLLVPFLAKGEEIVVTTSYAWMDTRWFPALIMQGPEPTVFAKISVEVPHGVSMNFQGAELGERAEFLPANLAIERSFWGKKENRAGLGTRYVFEKKWSQPESSLIKSKRLQLFTSFESSRSKEGSKIFDNWHSVSAYLYGRMDRYDFPSATIKEFSLKQTKEETTTPAKVVQILSFLKNDIDTRVSRDSFQDEALQPAGKTLSRRFGSPFDKAVLGKAMFASLGIPADLVAVSNNQENPNIQNFYTPALFNSVLLAIEVDSKTIYFDPYHDFNRFDQVPPASQGQAALVLRENGGTSYSLPYDSPDANQKNVNFNLSMDEKGLLSGEYDLVLKGLEASQAHQTISKQDEASGAYKIQEKLFFGQLNFFKWQTASLSEEKSKADDFMVNGEITPMLLAKKSDDEFILSNEPFLNTITQGLMQSIEKSQPTMSSFNAVIKLPENYIVSNLPNNIEILYDGLNLRFLTTTAEGLIKIEALSLVAFPVNKQALDNFYNDLKQVKDLNKLNIYISHKEDEVLQVVTEGEEVFQEAASPDESPKKAEEVNAFEQVKVPTSP